MRIEAIAIGTELLVSGRVDTNSVWIAERLADLGLAFHRKTAVGDDRAALSALFREALGRSELIVCTGGLGPTFDDFTKEVWAEVLGLPMEEDPELLRQIEAFFRDRGRACPTNNAQQARMPEGATPLPNPVGTAPGCLLAHGATRIVLLPGVPREMKRMWLDHVEPRLRPLAGAPTHTLRLLVGGVGESALEERTRPVRERHGQLDWSILASLGLVELVARSRDPRALEVARIDFEAELGEDRICTGEGSLESTVLDLLQANGQTLAVAESMTGGRVSALLTGVPGSSAVFAGGGIVYTPATKAALAGLSSAFLNEHGTVSEATTRALAEGIRVRLGTDWGLAITGNAGPSEDVSGPAPVGTSFLAVAGPSGTSAHHGFFPGERSAVQTRTASQALDFLRRCLLR